MESINFLNTGNSVNNPATFAASMTSSSLSISSETTQSANTKVASSLSFSEHLKKSIEPVKPVEPLIGKEIPEDDLVSLAEEIVTEIKSVVQKSTDGILSPNQQSESINTLIDELQLTEDNIQDIKKLIGDIEGLSDESVSPVLTSIRDTLSEIKNKIPSELSKNQELSDLSNTELSSTELSSTEIPVKEIPVLSQFQQTDNNSVVIGSNSVVIDNDLSDVDAVVSEVLASIDNDKEIVDTNIESRLSAVKIDKPSSESELEKDMNSHAVLVESINEVSNESIHAQHLTTEELKSKDLLKNKITLDDKENLINEIDNKIKDINIILDNTDITSVNNELLVELNTGLQELEKAINNSEIETEELTEVLAELNQLLAPINTNVPTDTLKEKVIELVNKLPASQQQLLMTQYQQHSNGSLENDELSTNELLMTIEKSHQALSTTSETAVFVNPLASRTENNNKSPILLNKMDFSVNDKLTTSEQEFEAKILDSVDLVSSDEPIDTIELDRMLSQLESNFKSGNQSQVTSDDTSVMSSRTEQQTIKELSSLQANAVKPAEIVPQKITLNDNPMAAQQLKEHLIMMSRGGVQQAVLQLDPEELGAMSVRILMQNDQMNVQFQVQNPQAKDMLEQTMEKLKESLQEQGIGLNQSDVEQQDQRRGQSQSAHEFLNEQVSDELDDTDSEVLTMTLHKQSSNGIDYYA